MLSYSLHGKLTPHALFFFHGLFGGKEDFAPMVEILSKDYTCICIDLPGHGSSPLKSDILSSLYDTVISIPCKTSSLVGYSLGGRLALDLYHRYRTFFSHLYLLSSHPGLETEEAKKERLAQDVKWIEKLESLHMEDFLHIWYEQPLFAPFKQKTDVFSLALERRKQQDPMAMASIFKQTSLAFQRAYRTFSPTTFFFCGEQDLKFTKVYQDLIPPNHLVMISQSGHMIPLENPNECAYKIRSLLQQTKVSLCNLY